MAFTIVTVAEMQFMAGENVDATGDVTANHQFLHDYANAYLSNLLKFDVLTNWATITANYKNILTEWAARYAATALIFYNVSGYPGSLKEATIMTNLHLFRMEQIREILEQADVQDFLGV